MNEFTSQDRAKFSLKLQEKVGGSSEPFTFASLPLFNTVQTGHADAMVLNISRQENDYKLLAEGFSIYSIFN